MFRSLERNQPNLSGIADRDNAQEQRKAGRPGQLERSEDRANCGATDSMKGAVMDSTKKPSRAGRWSLELITPDTARDWLDNRASNRAIVKNRVSLYSQHMRDGTWTLTHQGICLDVDGRVNDGQHRLQAIVDTGLAAWFWVYREASGTSGMRHFDKHQERSSLQSMQMSGYAVTSQLVSAARSVLADGKYSSGKINMSDERIWDCIELNRDKFVAIHFALGNAASYGGATFVAVMARAMWHYGTEKHGRVLRFVEVVNTGVCDGTGETGAIRYRDWAKTNTLGGGAVMRQHTYKRLVSALTSFMEGRAVTKLYGHDADPFSGCGIPESCKEQAKATT